MISLTNKLLRNTCDIDVGITFPPCNAADARRQAFGVRANLVFCLSLAFNVHMTACIISKLTTAVNVIPSRNRLANKKGTAGHVTLVKGLFPLVLKSCFEGIDLDRQRER